MERRKKSRTEHIALFVDLENFVGYCTGLGLPIDLAPEIEKLTEIGKVTIRRSFGDIHKIPMPYEQKNEIRKMLQRNLILHEDIPHWNNFKNSSDIRLVIEALSLTYTNDDIDLVAVVANDRDYLPLFSKLREIGKEVIGIGGSRDNTPDIYLNACDVFLYHETLCGKNPASIQASLTEPMVPEAALKEWVVSMPEVMESEPSTEAGLDATESTENLTDEATRLLFDALKIMESKGDDEPTGAAVIQVMRRLKADFDLQTYGHKSFKSLCERAAKGGNLAILQNGTTFKLRLCAPDLPQPVVGDPEFAAPQPAHVELLEWVENKMKAPLLDHNDRLVLYRYLLQYFADHSNVSLNDLSRHLSLEIVKDESMRGVYYKILYSLYRADCFCCSQGTSPYNPIIVNPSVPPGSEALLDRMFMENTLRLFVREKKASVDCEAWSEVFYRTGSEVDTIKEIIQML